MVRASRGERCVPTRERRKKRAVSEDDVEDRGSGVVCKGEACIQPRLVEERVAILRSLAVVGVQYVVFSRIERAQGVGGWVV